METFSFLVALAVASFFTFELCPLALPLLGPGPVPLLWQSSHLQSSLHLMPAWKHSQYFLRQWDLLQWQPFLCLWPLRIVGWKARGSRLWIAFLVSSTCFLFHSVFPQSLHRQSALQNRPPARGQQWCVSTGTATAW